MRRFLACVVAVVSLSIGATTAAAAPTQQTGLVNVNLEDITVQVPIAVAANICGVQIGALAVGLAQGQAVDCNSDAVSGATVTGPQGGAGPTTQEGLVNVNVSGVTVQLPVVIAANVCGLQVTALAVDVLQGQFVSCDARGNASAGA
jgi:hypothetical protein